MLDMVDDDGFARPSRGLQRRAGRADTPTHVEQAPGEYRKHRKNIASDKIMICRNHYNHDAPPRDCNEIY
jgi:hypothetical protein